MSNAIFRTYFLWLCEKNCIRTLYTFRFFCILISQVRLHRGFEMYEYKATIVIEGENQGIDVVVKANDVFSAKRLIEKIYGPVKLWIYTPQ